MPTDFTMFGYRSRASKDDTFVICHVAPSDHIIKRDVTLIVPLTRTHRFTKFCGRGDIMFSFYYMTSRYHVIKGTFDLLSGSHTP